MKIEDVLQERGTTYGKFIDNATTGQDLKDVVRRAHNWIYLSPDQKQMIDVIFDKISRIITGDPDYTDNYVDIEGYTRLVRERLERKNVERRTDNSSISKVTCTEGDNGEQAQAGVDANQRCDEQDRTGGGYYLNPADD